MVIIPTWERKSVDLPGASKVPYASDEAFGAGVGRAMSALGNSVERSLGSLGSALESQQNETDAVTAKIETANHEARVMEFWKQQEISSDPANASKVPGLVEQFAVKDAAATAPRIPQRYQGNFSVSSNGLRARLTPSIASWSLQKSFDYEGSRIKQAAGEQAAFLINNPADAPRAVGAMRSIIDEVNLPEWKKTEWKKDVGVQLLDAALQGYRDRNDSVGMRDALKTLQTTIPEMLGIGGNASDQPAQAPRAVLSPSDRDNVIRTIYGEARGETPEGREAVASVIRNRLVTGRWGRTATDVVHAQGQFEPWARPDARSKMQALKPTDKDYQDIGALVDEVFSGQRPDTTGGATHFYSPKVQGELGRQPPSWAKSVKLASIGTHEFYAPEGVAKQPSPMSGKPIEIAATMLGTDERSHRDVLSKFIGKVGGQNVDPTKTAWCAAFVNAVLRNSGYAGTDSLAARAFLNYGTPTDKPTEGDIVVLSRGSDPNKGHVGFYAGEGDGGRIKVLAGNQGDAVSIAEFSKSSVLGYRQISASDARATSLAGAAGADAWQKKVAEWNRVADGVENKNKEERKQLVVATDHKLISEEAAIRDHGDKGRDSSLSTEVLNGLYSPEKVNEIEQKRRANLDYWSLTTGWETKSEAERSAIVEKLNPVNSFPGPDYAYRAENYSRALKANADIQKKKDDEQKKNTDEAMKIAFDLHEKKALTPAVVETLRSRIPHGEYRTLLGLIRPDGGKDDPNAIVDLEKNIERSPEEFSKLAVGYLEKELIKTETFRSFIKENRGSKKDDMPPSPIKSGRDFVRNSLDPGMFGRSSEMYLRAARERAMAEFDAWAEATPEAKRSEAIATAEDIVKRHSILATNDMELAVGLSPYFGKVSRDAVTPDLIDQAEDHIASDFQNGRISQSQAATYRRQIDSWREILATKNSQQQQKPSAGGVRGRR